MHGTQPLSRLCFLAVFYSRNLDFWLGSLIVISVTSRRGVSAIGLNRLRGRESNVAEASGLAAQLALSKWSIVRMSLEEPDFCTIIITVTNISANLYGSSLRQEFVGLKGKSIHVPVAVLAAACFHLPLLSRTIGTVHCQGRGPGDFSRGHQLFLQRIDVCSNNGKKGRLQTIE